MKNETVKLVPRRGGRPSRKDAAKLEENILDAAATLFFSQGYGAVSIEHIAKQAQISKRTFYARYDDKAAIFRAVVHRVILRLRPPNDTTDQLFTGLSMEAVLRRIAPIILKASMRPEALALQHLVLAEAKRFPELAAIMDKEGARKEAITRIAALLQAEASRLKRKMLDPLFLAEQFLFMLTAAPQRRVLGLGSPLSPSAIENWAQQSVDLFLKGCWA